MFTREELEGLSIRKLRNLCRRYHLTPLTTASRQNRAHPNDSYIIPLITFSQIAITQFRQGKGLRLPSLASVQALGKIIEQMNTPTDEQKGLVNFSLENDKRMEGKDGKDQEELLRLGRVHVLLERAYKLLTGEVELM